MLQLIRPYLAVILDSFRAAMASRVLWVALIAIYVFLLAIAPVGYREVYTTQFHWMDLISNGTRLKGMLARGIAEMELAPGQREDEGDEEDQQPAEGLAPAGGRETPAGRIARHLPAELQNLLRNVARGQEVRIRLDMLADGLNSLYDSGGWYDTQLWSRLPRLRELRELERRQPEQLTEDQRKRRDRLRIEAALPGVFETRGSRSVELTYAGASLPARFQIEKSHFRMLLNHYVLRVIIDWLLGFVMIFLGILVTAGIIPEMLQPGSLHLLLSKPVTRPLLFLAKFVGGCAFVFLCVSQLIIGLWLVAGARLEIWNHRLLLCIPVCVFLFSVFYSVSAVAGLKWRSPILAIGLANLFGAGCLLIGFAGALSDSFVAERDRIIGLTTSDQTVIASTRGGNLRRFDERSGNWVDLFPEDRGRDGDRVVNPVRLDDGRLLTARIRGGRINRFVAGPTPLLVIDPQADWSLQPSLELPAGLRALLPADDGQLLVLGSSDLFIADAGEFSGETEQVPLDDESRSPADAPGGHPPADMFGSLMSKLNQMIGGATAGFQSILPASLSLTSPSSVALSADRQQAFVYSGTRLFRLDRPASGRGRWPVGVRAEVDSSPRRVLVRCLGDHLLVLRGEEPPLLYDSALQPIDIDDRTADQIAQLDIESAVSCHGALGGPGAVAVQTSGGLAQLISLQGDRLTLQRIGWFSGVEALHWDSRSHQLWIAHRIDRLSAWDLGSDELPRRPTVTHRPRVSGWRGIHRYLVTPLRSVTPQTGELGDTIAAIVSGEEAIRLPFEAPDEVALPRAYRIWRPLLTCGGFVIVMLSLGCLYFARTDF